MNNLFSYFDERLAASKKAGIANDLSLLRTSNGKSKEGHHSIPIEFAGKTLGALIATPPCDREKLVALAAQFGALWELPCVESGITLDRAMEALVTRYPVFDWCGIYRLVGDTLYLTCFRGAPTPHPIIPQSKGICGAAVAENRTLNIEDVTADPRYLSCDFRTRSELVVPIRNDDGKAIGEIDIDSHKPSAFSAQIAAHVEETARALAPLLLKLTSEAFTR